MDYTSTQSSCFSQSELEMDRIQHQSEEPHWESKRGCCGCAGGSNIYINDEKVYATKTDTYFCWEKVTSGVLYLSVSLAYVLTLQDLQSVETTPPQYDIRMAYFLWFVFGLAGVHRLYCQRYMSGLLMMSSFLSALSLLIALGSNMRAIPTLILVVICLVWVIDSILVYKWCG